jgi:hypothetical protein
VVVAAEEHTKLWAEFQAEIAQMRIEFLQAQLDEARGVKRIRPVPSSGSPGSMIA